MYSFSYLIVDQLSNGFGHNYSDRPMYVDFIADE